MKTIILTGGGTAGHIMPNLALLPELRKHFDKIIYLGAKGGLEEKIVPEYNIPLHLIDAVKFDREHIFSNFKIPLKLKKATNDAVKLLENIKPNVIFSKGGYVGLPICFAAKKLNIPYVIHESDFSMGLANKLVAKNAKKVLISFEETYKKGILVGTPIREEIFNGNKNIYKQKLNLLNKKTILIFGGSLGAKSINEFIYKNLDCLCEKYNVLHISGKSGNLEIKHKNYFQFNFVNDIQNLFALADVIVTRGGASSLAEITALNKKAVVIPLPKGASRGDQIQNAQSYQKKGKVEVILQENLQLENFSSVIENLLLKTTSKEKEPSPNKVIATHLADC